MNARCKVILFSNLHTGSKIKINKPIGRFSFCQYNMSVCSLYTMLIPSVTCMAISVIWFDLFICCQCYYLSTTRIFLFKKITNRPFRRVSSCLWNQLIRASVILILYHSFLPTFAHDYQWLYGHVTAPYKLSYYYYYYYYYYYNYAQNESSKAHFTYCRTFSLELTMTVISNYRSISICSLETGWKRHCYT